MALRNRPTTTVYEEEDISGGDTAVAEKEAPAPAAAPAETTAVAVQPSGALTKSEASAFAKEVEGMRGAADFSYGNYTVFKGNNGNVVNVADQKDSFGRWVKITMIAWDEHFEVTPAETTKTDKSKGFVAYSKNGETLDRVIDPELNMIWAGQKMSAYVEYLRREEGYTQADSRRFIDIAGVVHKSDSNHDYNGEIVQFTLSSSSIPSFKKYQENLLQRARAAARGAPVNMTSGDPLTFYLVRQLASKGSNNWTKLEVCARLPKL